MNECGKLPVGTCVSGEISLELSTLAVYTVQYIRTLTMLTACQKVGKNTRIGPAVKKT